MPLCAHLMVAGLSLWFGALTIFSHHCSQNRPCQRFRGSYRFSHSNHSRSGSECHRNYPPPELIRGGILPTLSVQGHLASEVERVHPTFLGLSRLQIFELPARSGKLFTSHAILLRRGLPRMKGKNLSYHFDANRRLFLCLLLFPQLAADSGKGLSQIGLHTFRVAERRIKDGLHLASTLVLCNTSPFHALRPCMSQEAFHLRPNCEGSATYRERRLPKVSVT